MLYIVILCIQSNEKVSCRNDVGEVDENDNYICTSTPCTSWTPEKNSID